MPSPSTSRGFQQSEDRLTGRQCAAIGRVAVLWSEIEYSMERLLARLALVPSLLGYVLTDKLGPDNRIAAIRFLLKVHEGKYQNSLISHESLSEIKELLAPLAKMKDERNRIVHSVWIKTSDMHLSRFDIDPSAPNIRVGYSERLEDIERFADEIEKMATRLWDIGTNLPQIDASLLNKLIELDQRNAHRIFPATQSTRQSQHRPLGESQLGPAHRSKKSPKRSCTKDFC